MWTGPYKVTRKVITVDYEIEIPGKWQERKNYHVKKWHVMLFQPHIQAVSLALDPAGTVAYRTSAVQYQNFYFDTISMRYFKHYSISI